MITKTPPGGAASLPGFHILVPVWGEAYCDLFTGISLPSQLADRNLPARQLVATKIRQLVRETV